MTKRLVLCGIPVLKDLEINGRTLLSLEQTDEQGGQYSVEIGDKSDIFIYRRYHQVSRTCYFASYCPVVKSTTRKGEYKPARLSELLDEDIQELATAIVRRDLPSNIEIAPLDPMIISRLRGVNLFYLREQRETEEGQAV